MSSLSSLPQKTQEFLALFPESIFCFIPETIEAKEKIPPLPVRHYSRIEACCASVERAIRIEQAT